MANCGRQVAPNFEMLGPLAAKPEVAIALDLPVVGILTDVCNLIENGCQLEPECGAQF